MAKAEQDRTIAEAHRILADLVWKGTALLDNGRVLAPDEEQLLAIYKWYAALRKPKGRSTPMPDDFSGKTDE